MTTISHYTLTVTLIAGLCLAGAGSCLATKGPATMTLSSTIDQAKKAKPALFPHAKHQEKLVCGECHHGTGADGKQVPYKEGQIIQKCESCHNTAAAMPKKLSTFKKAAHANCKACHKAKDKSLAKCSVCHPK